MKLYRTLAGPVIEHEHRMHALGALDWDTLINREDLHGHLVALFERTAPMPAEQVIQPLAPVGTQEVWAAGVTYLRSRDARVSESKDAGGGDFYTRVYAADRPELFFKATPSRLAQPGGPMRLRADSTWDVPEPEFTLYIADTGRIVAYTVGNALSRPTSSPCAPAMRFASPSRPSAPW